MRSHPDVDVIEEKPIINYLENVIKDEFNLGLDEIYNISEEQVEKLRRLYLKNLLAFSEKKKARILIDKFPFQTVCLPLINFIFTDAKFIFTQYTLMTLFYHAFSKPLNRIMLWLILNL